MKKFTMMLLWCVSTVVNAATDTLYQVGAGMHDITGPVAELGMLGYGMLDQESRGLHTRLRARAFVVANSNQGKRLAMVVADLPMITQSVHQGVMSALKKKWGARYTAQNVMISATHTHSGSGGYAFHTLYNVTTLGFNKTNYKNIVSGIVAAIEKAENNLVPGNIYIGRSTLANASKNRSLESYEKNPLEDREGYVHPFDTEMTLLKLVDADGNAFATLNWFPLHAVSMSNKNKLVSGDNKGVAEYLFEKDHGTDYSKTKTFVAAFAQANEGDVSPNIDGSKDDPLGHDFVRTYEAGVKQYKAAKTAFANASELVQGAIDYRFAYVDMTKQVVDQGNHHTCIGALGYAFAAGTDDGHGVDWFKQGDKEHKPFIDFLTSLIAKPTPEVIECQLPKPILIPTGLNKPVEWTPHIVPVQLIRLGQLVVAAVPGEFTTVSGRRLKKMLAEVMQTDVEHVVISGLSNVYTGYITTPEEYEVQRYEGGHTIFGKYTLNAYLKQYQRLAEDMLSGRETVRGKAPADISETTFNFRSGVVFDDTPIGKSFGDLYQQPNNSYHAGDTVVVGFWGGHPKNNLLTQKSFLEVQRKVAGHWQTVRHDWDLDTLYQWTRSGVANSKIKITWHVPKEAEVGEYRIVHHGHHKQAFTGAIKPYTGVSNSFDVR